MRDHEDSNLNNGFTPWRPWCEGGARDSNLQPPAPYHLLNVEKDMPGHKRSELLDIKGSYTKKVFKFVRKYWPELADWHDQHQNWNRCFLKCKFTF